MVAKAAIEQLPAANTAIAVRWYLNGQFGATGPMQTIAISEDPFSVGRSSKNALCLNDATVSSQHAELLAAANSYVLRDLGSTNGTFLNGHRLYAPALVVDGDMLQFGATVAKLTRTANDSHARTHTQDCEEDAVAIAQFQKLLEAGAIVPHFQPIVELRTGALCGYEALGRSRLFGLRSPAAMFRAAGQHNAEQEMGRLLRSEEVRAAEVLPVETTVFLNTHPTELGQPELVESLVSLRRLCPARPLVLEIHEAAVTNVRALTRLQQELRNLEIGLAFDDFGAGQTRLLELAAVRPEYVKFDSGLIRDIHRAREDKQRMLKSLVDLVRDLEIRPLAEGIEQPEEAAQCLALGFELAQGFLYGRPATARVCNRLQKV